MLMQRKQEVIGKIDDSGLLFARQQMGRNPYPGAIAPG
jgi:hypothetical protein